MKILMLGITAFSLASPAFACWSCEGLSDKECTSQIQGPQRKTVEEMVAKNQEFCDGKEQGLHNNYLGRQIGMISTDPGVAVYCTGKGDAGWVMASFDGVGAENKLEYFPLGENRDGCADSGACEAQLSAARKLLAEKYPHSRFAHAVENENKAGGLQVKNGPMIVFNPEASRKPASETVASSSLGSSSNSSSSGKILFFFDP